MGFWENVKQFNERWNDLPRRGAIVLMVLLALLAFAGLFSYIAPSVIAMVLAWVIHPVAKRLENVFRKIKLPAKLASLIAVIVMYGIVSFILFWIGARVVEEMRSLIAALPGWVSQASEFIQQWTAEGGFQTFGVEMFGWQVFDVPPEITDFHQRRGQRGAGVCQELLPEHGGHGEQLDDLHGDEPAADHPLHRSDHHGHVLHGGRPQAHLRLF